MREIVAGRDGVGRVVDGVAQGARGLAANALGSAATVERLARDMVAALRKVGKMEAIVARANPLGVVLQDWTPAQMDTFAKGEVETWGKVIRDNKITFTE